MKWAATYKRVGLIGLLGGLDSPAWLSFLIVRTAL
jgi:hypothetical protein